MTRSEKKRSSSKQQRRKLEPWPSESVKRSSFRPLRTKYERRKRVNKQKSKGRRSFKSWRESRYRCELSRLKTYRRYVSSKTAGSSKEIRKMEKMIRTR